MTSSERAETRRYMRECLLNAGTGSVRAANAQRFHHGRFTHDQVRSQTIVLHSLSTIWFRMSRSDTEFDTTDDAHIATCMRPTLYLHVPVVTTVRCIIFANLQRCLGLRIVIPRGTIRFRQAVRSLVRLQTITEVHFSHTQSSRYHSAEVVLPESGAVKALIAT